jgi:hypothetical protein
METVTMPPQTRRPGAKATPGKVGQRPASSPPKSGGTSYAEMITGGLLTIAGMLAGVNRKSAARVVLIAEQAGANVEALAAHDKRVAKFLDRFTAPTVYGAAAIPFITLGIGLAADAGLLAGTPLAHMAPPMPDELADAILAEVGIGSDQVDGDVDLIVADGQVTTLGDYFNRQAEAREFVASSPPPPPFDPLDQSMWGTDGYAPNTPETAAPPG